MEKESGPSEKIEETALDRYRHRCGPDGSEPLSKNAGRRRRLSFEGIYPATYPR
jgi:hypothetical protein